MSETTNTTILDLDALLDMDMDAVETLPDYVTPSAGSYVLSVKNCEIKAQEPKDGKPRSPRITIVYAIEDTVESAEAPFPNGSLFNESFLGTEEGVKYFKKQAVKLLNSPVDGAKLREIVDGIKEMDPFKAVITVRKTKDPETDKEYTNISVRPIHA